MPSELAITGSPEEHGWGIRPREAEAAPTATKEEVLSTEPYLPGQPMSQGRRDYVENSLAHARELGHHTTGDLIQAQLDADDIKHMQMETEKRIAEGHAVAAAKVKAAEMGASGNWTTFPGDQRKRAKTAEAGYGSGKDNPEGKTDIFGGGGRRKKRRHKSKRKKSHKKSRKKSRKKSKRRKRSKRR